MKDPLDLGTFGRTAPLSREFGFDRGTPVDRRYIERFLERNSNDIRGRTLEIGDDAYTRRYGGERTTRRDVLHVTPGHPDATIVADLTDAPGIPDATFDCIVLTQTLHIIYDARSALATARRILAPGGVLLATIPGVSQISADRWSASWSWSFSREGARALFADIFAASEVTIETWGNALASVAFLHGLAAEELRPEELDAHDPERYTLITVRAAKTEAR